MVSHLRRFDTSEIAKERLRIIKFYNEYGEKKPQRKHLSREERQSLFGKKIKDVGIESLGPLFYSP